MTAYTHQTGADTVRRGQWNPFRPIAASAITVACLSSSTCTTWAPWITWDPAVTDGLARDREVILFNNAGVSSSSGEVPTTFELMGANAIAFIRALGLSKVDVLGFSIGGMVAQEITLQAPDLVRKLILVGTGPRGGQGMASLTQVAKRDLRRCL